MNHELLNNVKQLLIDNANSEGRSLSDDFKTPAEFRQFVISFTIRSCVETLGMPLPEAYDHVMGEGSYKALADSCFARLQAKALAK